MIAILWNNNDITNCRTTIKSSLASSLSTFDIFNIIKIRTNYWESFHATRNAACLALNSFVLFLVLQHLRPMTNFLSHTHTISFFLETLLVFLVEAIARFSQVDMIYSIRIVNSDREVQHFAFRIEAAVAASLVFAAVP